MASSALATAFVNIVPGTQQLETYLKTGLPAQGQKGGQGLGDGMAKGFGSKIQSIMGPLLATFSAVAITRFVGDSVKAASDLTEAGTAATAIFGDAVGEINKWAKGAATSLGQSNVQAIDAAKSFGIFGQAAGLAAEDNAAFSMELGNLSADFASFYNSTPEEAIVAIGAALRGEAEPIRKFGVLMNEATLKAEAMKLGIIDSTKEALTPQQKILAAHALIMNQSGVAQGDFAKTSEGLANQQRIAAAQVENLKAKLGGVLLPVVTNMAKFFNEVAIPAIEDFGFWIKENEKWLTPLAITVASFVAAWQAFSFISWLIPMIQGLGVAMGILNIATVSATAAKWAENMAWLASPITWIILGIMAVVAAIVMIATQTTWFQDIWKVMSDAIGAAWDWLWNTVLKPVFDFIAAAFQVLWDYVIKPIITLIMIYIALWAMVFEWLYNTIIKPVFELIGKVFNWLWKNVIEPVINWVVGAFEAVGKTVSDVFGAIGKFIKDTFDGIVSIIRGPVNAIIDLINGMIDGLNKIQIKVPDWVPLIGGQTIGFNIPKIPKLAKGGFVDSPTTALIGEAGPEVVTPLKDFERMMGLDGNGSGKTINYYAAPNNSLDSEQALLMAMKRAKTVASW